jgi:hypothetical protein
VSLNPSGIHPEPHSGPNRILACVLFPVSRLCGTQVTHGDPHTDLPLDAKAGGDSPAAMTLRLLRRRRGGAKMPPTRMRS